MDVWRAVLYLLAVVLLVVAALPIPGVRVSLALLGAAAALAAFAWPTIAAA